MNTPRPLRVPDFSTIIKPVNSRGIIINRDLSDKNAVKTVVNVPGYKLDPISGRFSEIGDQYVSSAITPLGGKDTRWRSHRGQVDSMVPVTIVQKMKEKEKNQPHTCDPLYYRLFLDSPRKELKTSTYSNLPSKF